MHFLIIVIQEHHLELGISENDFVNWLSKEPQLLVWLSTFYRLSVSQKGIFTTQLFIDFLSS